MNISEREMKPEQRPELEQMAAADRRSKRGVKRLNLSTDQTFG